MDTFTFMITVLLMMIAVQFDQNWLVFAIVALMIISMRSISTTVLLIITTGALFFLRPYLLEYWPFVLFGLIILSVVLAGQQKPEQAGGYADMFGGGGGGGEMGGVGFGGGY